MDFDIKDLKKAKMGEKLAKERIIDSFSPLIISTLRRYYIISQDNIQELILEILKGIESYDPSRGISFPGYLKIKLRHRALEILREKKHHSHLSLNHTNKKGEEMEYLIPDSKTTEDIIIDKETEDILDRAINKLKEEDKLLIHYHFDLRLKPKEIAKKLGIKERTFRFRKRKILDQLRRELNVLRKN